MRATFALVVFLNSFFQIICATNIKRFVGTFHYVGVIWHLRLNRSSLRSVVFIAFILAAKGSEERYRQELRSVVQSPPLEGKLSPFDTVW